MVELVGDVVISETLERVNGNIIGFDANGDKAYELTFIKGGYKAKLFGATKAAVYAARAKVVPVEAMSDPSILGLSGGKSIGTSNGVGQGFSAAPTINTFN